MAHEASISPIRRQPLLRYRYRERRWKAGRRLEAERPDYLRQVFDEVADNGPTSVRGLRDPGERGGSWWGWAPGKVALEWLYVTGRLAIAYRDAGFVTYYDMPARVFPSEVLAAPTPTPTEAIRELLIVASRAAGLASVKDLADWFRIPLPIARAQLGELLREGRLEAVELEGSTEVHVLHPEVSAPRRIEGTRLLSPFDPVVWCRPRAKRLFGFNYKIEIYVPAPDRVHGYYVLPVLSGSQLCGRLDMKADRQASVLLIKGAYLEDGAQASKLADEIQPALIEMMRFLGLDGISIEDRGPLAPALAAAVRKGW